MRALFLALVAVTVVLSGACFYLFRQLNAERGQEQAGVATVSERSTAGESPAHPGDAAKETGSIVEQQGVGATAQIDPGLQALMESRKIPPERRPALVGYRSFMRRIYADLIRQMKLSPAETEQFLQLLFDSRVKYFELPVRGRVDFATAQATRARLESEADTALASFFGPERFREYEDYRKTLPDRNRISGLNSMLTSIYAPLSARQRQELLAVLRSEKELVAPPNSPGGPDVRLDSLPLTPEMMQWYEDYNSRVRERAARILTSEQLKVYDFAFRGITDAELAGLTRR